MACPPFYYFYKAPYGKMCLKGGDIMSWNANIFLNTGNHIDIENLISVDRISPFDGTVTKITDFKNFQLPQGQISFVGENNVVAINTKEIKYVQLSQD